MRGWVRLVAVLLAIALAIPILASVFGQPAALLSGTPPLEYEDFIVAHAENYGLEPALIAAVINVESGFDPDAESEAGATGLMQLTRETGQGIADRTGGSRWTEEDLHDPELNIRYGAWYLAHLVEVFADQPDPTLAALAAYNGGQGNVRTWAKAAGGELRAEDIEFPETRAYVEDVLELEERYRDEYPSLKTG